MKQIPNNAVKHGDKELEKGGEIPENLTQRCTELPKLIAVVELMYSRGRTVAQFIRWSTRGIKTVNTAKKVADLLIYRKD